MLLGDCKPGDLISMEEGKSPVYEVMAEPPKGHVVYANERALWRCGKWEGYAGAAKVTTEVFPWPRRRPRKGRES